MVDSGAFKGAGEVGRLKEKTREDLEKYVAWARTHGLRADYRMTLGTEAVPAMEEICRDLVRRYPRAIVFLGKLIFREEDWYQPILHNETALALQRRLQFEGIQTIVLPIRVLAE